jgi:hypothetical protein
MSETNKEDSQTNKAVVTISIDISIFPACHLILSQSGFSQKQLTLPGQKLQ